MQAPKFRIPELTSIRIHAKMSNTKAELDLSIVKKQQDRMRVATLEKTGVSGRIIQIYSSERIYEIWEKEDGNIPQDVNSLDAATSLFDLISLTPEYHFREKDGFDFGTEIFEGYNLELKRVDEDTGKSISSLPEIVLLYHTEGGAKKLIRSIRYISFFEEREPYTQPKELIYTDETSGESGRITVQKVEYNVGLPDFLFDLGEDTENAAE